MNGENMKIICLEENYLDSELGRACMPVALEQAPFLGDWGKPSLMVIILTDSLLSRFNKLNVPLYLHPGLPLKSVQQAYFTGFSAEVNSGFLCLPGLASRSGDPFVAADVIGCI